MRIKSYFADSVQEAIEKARTELGPEAMLMNSKKTDLELRSLGIYEVVFGVAVEAMKIKSGTRPANSESADGSAGRAGGMESEGQTNAAGEFSGSGEFSKELADLRHQIETVKRSVSRQRRSLPVSAAAHSHPGAADLCARLMAADFSEDLAQEIAEASELRAFAARQPAARPLRDFELVPAEMLELALRAELDRMVQTAPGLGLAGEKSRVVLLAGPSGAGKTTALIKLGLRYGLRARLPLHLLSLDTRRVGGWEQLACYARIAGVGFDAVHNWNTLSQTLAQLGPDKLILIDTPGIGAADMKEMAALTHCCSQHAGIDVHLVCPVTLRASTASRVWQRFQALGPAKLLLTHTDESETPGSLLELAIRSALPISYLSTGQNIPEDIEAASKEKLLSGFTRQALPAAASAA